ncbi:hypothetical protein [Methylomagnum sp.]
MNVEELEREVSQLPPSELKQFSEWFDEFKADQWDKQIEEDILAGRFDSIAQQVLESGSIPFPKQPTLEQRKALEEAGKRLDEKLAKLGINEDEVVEDFKQWRRQRGNA